MLLRSPRYSRIVGYRHSRDEVVDAAARVALDGGIARLTFRRVADELGISDRMVVYYLPTKADLVLTVATELSMRLQSLLHEAFGEGRRDPDDLVRQAWPVIGSGDTDRVFALFLEVVGLGAAGVKPYDGLSNALLTGWVEWLAERTAGATPAVRRRAALGVIARIDGLLLIRHAMGAPAAEEAAAALGVRRRR